MENFEKNEVDDPLQIEDLKKNKDRPSEGNIDDDNYILSKERPSELSKNTDNFYQQNDRFTTIENNFENPQEDSLASSNLISNRPSNIPKEEDNNDNEINKSNNKDKNRKTRNSNKNRIEIKIILLGDVAVGKTSILGRYINNSFNDDYKCTIQVEHKTKIIDVDLYTSVKMTIWDTVGQEKFRILTKQYYRDAQGAIIVFDLTKKESFDFVPKWIEELNNNGPGKIPIIIVGNKSDLSTQRVVPMDEIKKIIGSKYLYYDVSAKNGNNISLAFDKIRSQVLNYLDKKKDDNDIRVHINPRTSKELDEVGQQINEKSTKCC